MNIQSRANTRILLITILILTGGLGCNDDAVQDPTVDPPRPPVFEPAPSPRPPVVEGFALGPIDGLTTGWHAMPEVELVPVPAGGDIDLRFRQYCVFWTF